MVHFIPSPIVIAELVVVICLLSVLIIIHLEIALWSHPQEKFLWIVPHQSFFPLSLELVVVLETQWVYPLLIKETSDVNKPL